MLLHRLLLPWLAVLIALCSARGPGRRCGARPSRRSPCPAIVRDACACPAGWTLNPTEPVFPSTCFRFISNPDIDCSSVTTSGAVVGVCRYPQLVTLPRCNIFRFLATECTSAGGVPLERNGEWRCVEFLNVAQVEGQCPPNTFAQCLQITKFISMQQ